MTAALVRLAGRDIQAEVRRKGDGPALLYLHGAFGPEWSDALVDALGASFSVYQPSLPGYGESEGLEQISTFSDLSMWVEELLDALGLGRVVVVGHDFGGAVAAEFAAAYRARVERLVLLAPLGLWLDEAPVADMFGLTPGALTRALFADEQSAPAMAFNSRPADRAQATREILRRRQALIAAAKLLWPLPDKGLRKRLYRVQAPTLIAWGEADRLAPPVYAEAFAARIQGATVRSVARAGHMLPQEAPEAVAGMVREFAGAGSPAGVA